MIKNYLKISLRYLARHKGYTAINILGLTVGITCCVLIMVYVKSEWSYDRFHSNADKIFRARIVEHYEGEVFSNTVTPLPLGPALKTHIPEVRLMSRVFRYSSTIKNAGKDFSESIHMVDNDFFKIFDFKIIEGSRNEALKNSSSIVLTREMAEKYFGDESPVGKTLEISIRDKRIPFTVTAVTENPPLESSIRYDFLISFSNDHYLFSEKQRTGGWSNVYGETYVLLQAGSDGARAEEKLPAMIDQVTGDRFKPGQFQVFLQPITDIHLNNKIPEGIEPISDPKYSYILGSIGFLILLIACINFITLSIGRSVTRATEVGIRKVLGAGKRQLVYLYWGESFVITTAATIAGIMLAVVLLPAFSGIVNRELHLKADLFTLLGSFVILILVALISGIYPALVLSGYGPIQALKGKLQTAVGIGTFRKGLIVAQFAASILMIIGTLVIGPQLNFLRNKDLGFEKEQTIIVSTNKSAPVGKALASRLKQQLKSNPEVISSTESLYSFAEPGWIELGYKDDKNVFRQFRVNEVDYDFIGTMKLELIAGRNFSEANGTDIREGMIINEAMAREYGWTEPIGKKLPGNYDHQVIGMVRDFNYESLHNPVKPLAMVLLLDSMLVRSSDMMFSAASHPRVTIRLKPGNYQNQITAIQKDWESVAPDQNFQFRFLDETLNAAYQNEQRLGSLVRYAAVISIMIACLGLFGLATLIVIRRTREIGIRKVLGANLMNIVMLVSKDFLLLVIIASAIAFPLAWYGLHKWLQDFTYRIEIPLLLFFAAAVFSLLIAMITVGLQAAKAAMLNPAETLKTE